MRLNYEPKYGVTPQFTPSFVSTVVRTVVKSGGTLDISLLAKLICFENRGNLDELIKTGIKFGFWDVTKDQTVEVKNAQNLSASILSPLHFAHFVHDSLYSLQLDNPKNWNSLSALLAWAYSLKLTQSDSQRQRKEMLIPWSYELFEEFGIQSKLCASLDDGSTINKNETQWNASRKWLQQIGIFMYTKDSLTPSPQILKSIIHLELSTRSELVTPIRELVEGMRSRCPFLPGGKYGKMWTEHVRSQWGNDLPESIDCDQDFKLSEQESLVLQLLEARKWIALSEQNDAGDSFSLTGGTTTGRKITHFQKLVLLNG